MTSNGVSPIISEDYADLLIDYGGNEAILEQYGNYEIINYFTALVHIPASELTNQSVYQFGYAAIPSLFAPISLESLEASGIARIRNIPNFNLIGQGVLVGIIDTGIDYTNPIFINADNTTRIAYLWDQTIQTGPPPQDRNFGTIYTREQINQALQSENPFDAVPSTDTVGHGTMVAGIAGGNTNADEDFSGVATGAEYIVVKLKPAKSVIKRFFMVPEDILCYQESDIMFAVRTVLDLAYSLERPLALCLALGSSQGGHDGRGILSRYLSIIAAAPGVVVVVAAGNEGNSRRHYSGMTNTATGYDVVELNVGENENGFSMELWGQAPSIFSIDILSPSGEYVPRIAVGMNENREISFIFERTIIYVDYQMVESLTGDQLILIRFENPATGIWRFNVYERGDLHLGYNVWLPMGDLITTNTFFVRSDPYTTILSAGNADVPLTVSAYNYLDDSLYINASRGYTRLGRIEPSVVAPGVGVIGPTLDQGFTTYEGTSVSAAQTTGVAAMILEWAVVRQNLPGLSTVEFKKLVIRGARRDPDIQYPNRDWGYGILDVFNIFDSLRTGVVV